jgi:Secretion system C-terminal sorting domain/PQQ-like domain
VFIKIRHIMIKIMKIKIVAAVLFLIIIPINAQQQQQIPWPTLADSPWPMVSHDPQATGRSNYVGPKTPNVIWTMDMPYGILSGPALGEDETMYFGTRSILPLDTTNYFYAVNSDGSLKWEFLTGEISATTTGPLVSADSTVYFCSQGGFLYAVGLEGQLKWKYFASSAIFQFVINIDLKGNVYFTGSNGYLYSINRNGILNWKVDHGVGFGFRSVVFAPDGQTLYVGAADSNFYALNQDGSIKWIYSCNKVTITPLVDNEGNIYFIPDVSGVTEVHCVKPDGTSKWIYITTEYLGADQSYGITMNANGNIYYSHKLLNPTRAGITSLDYNGNYRWTYDTNLPSESIKAPLICDNEGTIYFGSTWGNYYYAISNEGELLWKLPLDGYQVDNSGAIGSDGTLYIGTHLSSTSTGQEKTLIAVRDSGATSVDGEVFLNNYILHQNYPNPFNPSTTIKYQLSSSGIVTLKVYDILGREVTTLVNEFKSAGSYKINFNASNLSSGVYIYRVTATNNGRILFQDSKQMILLR